MVVVLMFVLTEQMVVWVSFIFEGESSVTDMIQILQPLKVGDCHSTSVQVQILRGDGERQGADMSGEGRKRPKRKSEGRTVGHRWAEKEKREKRKKGSSVRKWVKETTEAESVRHKRPFIHSQYFCFRLTGITRMFLSMKILSASGVVGPLAPSAIIWQNKQKHRLPRHNGKKQESLDLLNESTVCMRVYLGFDLVCIPLGQLFLSSCRDQDVTVGLKKVSFVWGRVRKTNDGSILLKTEDMCKTSTDQRPGGQTSWDTTRTDQFILLKLFWVHAVGVPDASIQFCHPNALGSESMKVTHGVKTHISKTLQTEQRSVNSKCYILFFPR